MRLASFNLQNLFDRASILDVAAHTESSVGLAMNEFNALIEKPEYSQDDKVRLLDLLPELGIEGSDAGSSSVLLRQNRGRLLARSPNRISVAGRFGWVGWLEAKRSSVKGQQLWNTARVIAGLDADVLAVMEVEGRTALSRFNKELLGHILGTKAQRKRWRFEHIMVIDGNDSRGIDVGLMTQAEFPIHYMRSHVHDVDASGRPIFSRDCPEFQIRTPAGNVVWILVNHFKSKFGGNTSQSDNKRRSQATAVRDFYDRLTRAEQKFVAVVGDLNDVPDSQSLQPLLRDTNLRDVSGHDNFITASGLTGTHGECREGSKLDYILLSPALFDKVTWGTVFRTGLWPSGRKSHPEWEILEDMTGPEDSASDHAPIVVDIDV